MYKFKQQINHVSKVDKNEHYLCVWRFKKKGFGSSYERKEWASIYALNKKDNYTLKRTFENVSTESCLYKEYFVSGRCDNNISRTVITKINDENGEPFIYENFQVTNIKLNESLVVVYQINPIDVFKSPNGIFDLEKRELLWLKETTRLSSIYAFTETNLYTGKDNIIKNFLIQDGTLLFEVNLDEIVTTDPSVDEYIKILGVYGQSLLIAYRGKVFMLDAQTGKLQKEWERISLQRELYQKGIYHYFYRAVHFVLDATQGKIIGLNEDNYVEIDLKTDKVTVLNRSQYYQRMSITEAHRAICLTPTHIITTAEANPRHSPKHDAVIRDYWVIALNRETKEIDWRHEFTFDEGIWLAGTNPPQIIDNQLFIKSNNDKLIIFDKIEMNQ